MNSMTFKKDLIGVQNDLLRFAYKLTSDREEANGPSSRNITQGFG